VRLPNIVGIYNPYNVWKRLHTPTSYAFRILFKLCHSALVKAVYGQREEVVLYQRKTVSRYSASSYPIRNFVNIYNICRLLFGLVKYYENKQGCRDLFNYTEDNQYLSVFDLHNAVRNIVGTPASVFKDSKPKRECLFMGCDSSKIKELGFDYQSISMERSILETCVDIMAKHMNLIKGISESGFNKYISVYGDEEWN
jgi:nucleoside-diphosphate-sugar epimerase